MRSDLKIKKSQKPLKPQDLEAFEQSAQITLPQDYKDFLLQHNGGEPNLCRYQTKDGKIIGYLVRFLHLDKKKEPNLEDAYQEYTLGGLVPRNFLLIGCEPGWDKWQNNDSIVLSISGPDAGKVYHWNAGAEPLKPHKPSTKYMYLIADSFTEFLEGLWDEALDED